ncbi:MAG: NAD(P)-dependent oxidoreductase [Nitrospiraceae bacterium]|nr:NAD(P)-dependent oxidoreductase [Nitrospiraceae bacterium]
MAKYPLSVGPSIGWIGTGVMGRSMCGHLLDAGYSVWIHTRTRAKAEPLLALGARWEDTPLAVAVRADTIITMVGMPADVREVYFGATGLLAGARSGSLLIDMTTTDPSLSREIADVAAARGVQAIDAPVSGGDVGARNATLSIMIGGEQPAVARARPLLEQLGKILIHQGGPGSGQDAKLCNQIVIAGTMIGVCESLLYGHHAGLDLATMLQSIRGGAAACWTLDHLAPKILQRHFEPGFFVEHFVKDMGIALQEATRRGLTLPGLSLVHTLYEQVVALGHGRSGTHALMLALEELSQSHGADLSRRP